MPPFDPPSAAMRSGRVTPRATRSAATAAKSYGSVDALRANVSFRSCISMVPSFRGSDSGRAAFVDTVFANVLQSVKNFLRTKENKKGF